MIAATEARQWILESRLGSCWRCMLFTVCMLVISAMAFVMAVRWLDLEGRDSALMGRLMVGAAFLSCCAFAFLAMAHLVSLVLKRIIWRQ